METINNLNIVIEDLKTKKQQKVHYGWLKRFSSRNATTDERKIKEAKRAN